jgi:hypothetical protein
MFRKLPHLAPKPNIEKVVYATIRVWTILINNANHGVFKHNFNNFFQA